MILEIEEEDVVLVLDHQEEEIVNTDTGVEVDQEIVNIINIQIEEIEIIEINLEMQKDIKKEENQIKLFFQ